MNNADILKLSEPVEQAYEDAAARLVLNIARHLGSGRAIHTAKWEVQKLSELGQLTRENAEIINFTLRGLPDVVTATLDETARESLDKIDTAINAAIASGAVAKAPIDSTREVIENLSAQAVDQFNLVNTTMLQSGQAAYLRAVNDVVQWENTAMEKAQEDITLATLNTSTMALIGGGETRALALRRAVGTLAENGLTGFVDSRGRHWQPEGYVNMCMRTTIHNCAVKSIQARQTDYGSNIFQCSYHPGSRPEHAPFQNKFYSWDDDGGEFTDGAGVKHKFEPVSVTGYGTAAGLFGINCGHLPLPQIPGVTIPTDPPMQSAAEDKKLYNDLQTQRALERNIRTSKRMREAYLAVGDKEAAAKMDAQIMARYKALDEFTKANGLTRRPDREVIGGKGMRVTVATLKKKADKTAKAEQKAAAKVDAIKIDSFPDVFRAKKAEAKNTQTLIDFINSKAEGANPTVVKLYGAIGKMFARAGNQFPFSISHGSKNALTYWYTGSGRVSKAKLAYPNHDNVSQVGALNMTLHEMMHMIDFFMRVDVSGHQYASATGTPAASRLFDLFDHNTVTMGERVKSLFDAFNKRYFELEGERTAAERAETERIKRRYYPDGQIHVFDDIAKYEKYKKERDKAIKGIDADYNEKKRAVMGGGVDDFQDIYDALSHGKYRDTGVVLYGHGSKYYRVISQRAAETVANYGALSISRPDLIEMLREDQPDLVAALDDLLGEMLERTERG